MLRGIQDYISCNPNSSYLPPSAKIIFNKTWVFVISIFKYLTNLISSCSKKLNPNRVTKETPKAKKQNTHSAAVTSIGTGYLSKEIRFYYTGNQSILVKYSPDMTFEEVIALANSEIQKTAAESSILRLIYNGKNLLQTPPNHSDHQRRFEDVITDPDAKLFIVIEPDPSAAPVQTNQNSTTTSKTITFALINNDNLEITYEPTMTLRNVIDLIKEKIPEIAPGKETVVIKFKGNNIVPKNAGDAKWSTNFASLLAQHRIGETKPRLIFI